MNVFDQKIITENLRKCQKEAYEAILNHYSNNDAERSILIQLPTGTGKTALIAIAPFGIAKNKVLILTPNLKLTEDIDLSLDLTRGESIYHKLGLLSEDNLNNLKLFPLRLSNEVSHVDIENHQILVANYHQLNDIQKWFKDDKNNVDLIIIDEAHHQEAVTYKDIIKHFIGAKVIGLTGTPFRSDSKEIEGKKIYTYHYSDAIKDGVIRNILTDNISPKQMELTFKDGENKLYTLEDILKMSEESWFNKGIYQSQDCCDAIASLSFEKLKELRQKHPESRHQIIAVAMTKKEAREQIKTAYTKLGLKVGIVSSDDQEKKTNNKTFNDLKTFNIDVIIHISMLKEGFDHPPLGVAAIFKPFKSLNPYIQFVGRVIRRNENTRNCYVVSHLGLNQIKRFEEFKLFDSDDKLFLENCFIKNSNETSQFKDSFINENDAENRINSNFETVKIRDIGDEMVKIYQEFIPSQNYINAKNSVNSLSVIERAKLFEELGICDKNSNIIEAKKSNRIKPIDEKKAARTLLHEKEKTIVNDIMKELKVPFKGRNFNRMFENFKWIKKDVSKRVNKHLGIDNKSRRDLDNKHLTTLKSEEFFSIIKFDSLTYFKNKLFENKT